MIIAVAAYLPALVAMADAPNGRSADHVRAANGRDVTGRIDTIDARGQIAWADRGGERPSRLADVRAIRFRRAAGAAEQAPRTDRIVVRGGSIISGRFLGMEKDVLFLAGVGEDTVALDRASVASIEQRRGDVTILAEDFERDLSRWAPWPGAQLSRRLHRSGRSALVLACEPTGAIRRRLTDAVHAGRVTVWFHDDARLEEGLHWFCELEFAKPSRRTVLRISLGWDTPSYAVAAQPPMAMSVQPLARRDGWRRLNVDLSPDATTVTIDAGILAKGPPMGLPLATVHFGTAGRPQNRRPGGKRPNLPLGYLDDLEVVRRLAPVSHRQEDPSQDEALLVGGDQIFGRLTALTPEAVTLQGAYGTPRLPWDQVQSVMLRRRRLAPQTLSGWFVTAHCDNDDRLAGVLVGLDRRWLRLDTTFAGRLKLGRERVRRLVPAFHGTRIEIDNDYHHLGDTYENDLAVPEPEGARYETTFKLGDQHKAGRAMVAFTVVQMVGVGPEAAWRKEVLAGELRTFVEINDQRVGSANDQVPKQSDTPVRVRLPVPARLLRTGSNKLAIVSTPRKEQASQFDDFGFWNLALEIQTPSR